jgi:hypothetical protein
MVAIDDILASSPELEKHERLLGRVAVQWTRMHEIMAMVFGYLVSPDDRQRGHAAWHALKNDRAQRDMLRDVSQVVLPKGDPCKKAIEWATGQLVAKEDDRNNALHTPYALVIEDGKLAVIPVYFTGNKRAVALKGRDLVVELTSYADNFKKIGDYMWEVTRIQSRPPPLNALADAKPPKLPPPPPLPKPAQAIARRHRNKD